MASEESVAASPTPRRYHAVIARHREILRLTVLGWLPTRIATHLGLSPAAVRVILRSPLARAELEKLQEAADAMTINTPLRASLEAELRGATVEAVRASRRMMNDPRVDAKVRTRIQAHFMDRVLFDRNGTDETQGGYREILRRLDEVDKQLGRGVWLLSSDATDAASEATPVSNGSSNGHVHENNEPLYDKLKESLGGAIEP